jgi:hypothetical protein
VWRNAGSLLQSRTSCDHKNDLATNRIFFERTPNTAVQTVVSVIAEQEKLVCSKMHRPVAAKLTSSWREGNPMLILLIDGTSHMVRFRHPGKVAFGKGAEGNGLAVDRDLILANLDDLAWQSDHTFKHEQGSVWPQYLNEVAALQLCDASQVCLCIRHLQPKGGLVDDGEVTEKKRWCIRRTGELVSVDISRGDC